VSLRDGVGSLSDAIVGRLREQGATLRPGTRVEAVVREGARWIVHLTGAERPPPRRKVEREGFNLTKEGLGHGRFLRPRASKPRFNGD